MKIVLSLLHWNVLGRFVTFRDESGRVSKQLDRLGKIRVISSIPPPDVVFSHTKRLFEVIKSFLLILLSNFTLDFTNLFAKYFDVFTL